MRVEVYLQTGWDIWCKSTGKHRCCCSC